MTTLLLWRHGLTVWNAERRIQGHADVDLSDEGRQQAKEAAERLAGYHPTSIVSSDLRRAADTAGALADLTGLPVRYDQRLRERHFGPWQGLTGEDLQRTWPEEYRSWRAGAVAFPGLDIESIDDLARRAGTAAREAAAADPAGAAAVVVVATHGGTARQACASVLGWRGETTRSLAVLGNCRWTELRRAGDRDWALFGHNLS